MRSKHNPYQKVYIPTDKDRQREMVSTYAPAYVGNATAICKHCDEVIVKDRWTRWGWFHVPGNSEYCSAEPPHAEPKGGSSTP